jgi:hypothetical protein
MREYVGVHRSFDSLQNFFQGFLTNNMRGSVPGAARRFPNQDAKFTLPRKNWGLGSGKANKSFQDVFGDPVFRQSVENALAQGMFAVVVANGSQEICEVIVATDKALTKHKGGRQSLAPNSHGAIAKSNDMFVVAWHQNHLVGRGVRKADSVATSGLYWSIMGPTMTPFWITRGIKGGIKGALGLNKRHDLSNINIDDNDL